MSIVSRSLKYGEVFGGWHLGKKLEIDTDEKSAVFELYREHQGRQERSLLKVINLIHEKSNQNCSPEYTAAARERCAHSEQLLRRIMQLRDKTNILDYREHSFLEWCDETGFGTDLVIRTEYLTDLRSAMKRGQRFSQQQIVKLGSDVCRALADCHEQNILHRDIKPEDIFFGEDGNIKLGNIGMSQILGKVSPAYAAPEHFSGHYDHRVDIYSIGLVLYELSNRNTLPFAASGCARQEAIQKRQAGTPIPRPEGISDGFWRILQKACAHKPADRYSTAREFLKDLCRPDSVKAPAPAFVQQQNQAVNAARYAVAGGMAQSSSQGTAKSKPHTSTAVKRKKIALIGILAGVAAVIAVLLVYFLWGGHTHTWMDATCTAARICEECGDTEGVALGHSWLNATCVTPKICRVCQETEGTPLGHQWSEADCATPKTCTVCGRTEGAPLDHQWIESDCATPRTCKVCNQTEGTPLGHQWIEATCTSPMICAVCNQTQGKETGHQWVDADTVSPKTCSVCGETEGRSLGYDLGNCSVLADSNEEGTNTDVVNGAWNDKSGLNYSPSLRFWIADYGTWSDTEWIEYDIGGQFRQLDLTTTTEYNSAAGASYQVMVYADGKLIYTSEWIDSDMQPVQERIDIQNCSRLRIVCTTDSPAFCYCIVQGMLYN